MKRLLVTGVPGWLTNALLESLAGDPPHGLEEVRCMMLQAGPLPALPASRLKFTSLVGRLEEPADLQRATAGCDVVLHAAGILHVKRVIDWYRVNTEGTRHLVEASIAAGVRRIVLISTNAAAGKSPHKSHLMAETDRPVPLSHYGRSKLLAEDFVLKSGLEGVVLRPCMFYGPPVPPRHVDIYQRILTGRMPMVGHGEYARSVTHIDNLVLGCRLALSRPEAVGQTYYIADAKVYTTRSIVEAMARALKAEPRYLRLPGLIAPLAFLFDRCLAAVGLYWQNLHLVGEADWHVGVSIEKARRELGYEPTQELESGMQGAVDWCAARGLIRK